jgi:mannose-6-phosphate isomerase-like protein (cupin superfamily)
LTNAGDLDATTRGSGPDRSGHWVEQLRVDALSVGTYTVPAGGLDPQQPHTEDEVYVVVAGRARIVSDSGSAPVVAGSVVYVPAGENHRFVEVTDDLVVVVVFAPPEYSLRGV